MTRAWSEAAIPGLTGITAVVTEASGGIGLQVTRGLARPSQQRHNRNSPASTAPAPRPGAASPARPLPGCHG
jgi:hypothetical protein